MKYFTPKNFMKFYISLDTVCARRTPSDAKDSHMACEKKKRTSRKRTHHTVRYNYVG